MDTINYFWNQSKYNDPRWIPQLSIFNSGNKNIEAYNFSTNVVCTALTLYCLMNSFKDTIDIVDIALSNKQLMELNENEINMIFKDLAYKFLDDLTSTALISTLNDLNASILNLIEGLSKDLDYWKIPKMY